MDLQSYERNMRTLTDWFGKKLTDQQLEAMWTQLHELSEASFRGAVGNLIKDRPPNPSRFPTIQELANETWRWQADHPAPGFADPDRTDCKHCFGEGTIPIRYYDRQTARWYESIVFCGHCNNYRRHIGSNPENETLKAHGRMTKYEITERGYQLIFNDSGEINPQEKQHAD